jgi:hypothetical protein
MASLIRRLLRRSRSEETGAELIEFALVLPILLLIVAGIVDFGFLFQRYEVVTNAAREGARIASLPGYTEPDVQQRVLDYLTTSGLTETPTVSLTSAPTALPSGRTVQLATVVVDYPHTYMLIGPFANLLGGSGGWGTVTLRGTSVMRFEGSGSGP